MSVNRDQYCSWAVLFTSVGKRCIVFLSFGEYNVIARCRVGCPQESKKLSSLCICCIDFPDFEESIVMLLSFSLITSSFLFEQLSEKFQRKNGCEFESRSDEVY